MKLEHSGSRVSVFREIGLEEVDPPPLKEIYYPKMSLMERIDEEEEPEGKEADSKTPEVLRYFVEQHMVLFGAIAIVVFGFITEKYYYLEI
jgi:hypothetical protein